MLNVLQGLRVQTCRTWSSTVLLLELSEKTVKTNSDQFMFVESEVLFFFVFNL